MYLCVSSSCRMCEWSGVNVFASPWMGAPWQLSHSVVDPSIKQGTPLTCARPLVLAASHSTCPRWHFRAHLHSSRMASVALRHSTCLIWLGHAGPPGWLLHRSLHMCPHIQPPLVPLLDLRQAGPRLHGLHGLPLSPPAWLQPPLVPPRLPPLRWANTCLFRLGSPGLQAWQSPLGTLVLGTLGTLVTLVLVP